MTASDDYVRRLLDETRQEVARADGKASIVLAAAGVVVGILLSGLVTGDVSLEGEPWYVNLFAWLAGILLTSGLASVGWAVYPQTQGAEPGHARWFAEVEQHGDDLEALRKAAFADAKDGGRDLQQTIALAGIVGRKYRRTKAGMWLFALGLLSSGLAGLLGAEPESVTGSAACFGLATGLN